MVQQAARVICRQIPLALLEGSTELFTEHYDEVALDKSVPMDVNWGQYRGMERLGVLLCVGAFVHAPDSPTLVGYTAGYLADHLHYKLRVYYNTVLFVAKDFRRMRAGLDLMEKTEESARARGAQRVAWHAKPDTVLDRVLSARGYTRQDIVYTRGLT